MTAVYRDTHIPSICVSRYIDLPWPPSGNHCHRSTSSGRRYSTARYRAWRTAAVALARATGVRVPGHYRILVECHPPDRRRRDLDNAYKPVSDALEEAGVVEDDAFAVDVRLLRKPVEKGGRVRVTVRPVECDG